ncbi:nitroreductase family protein [Amycolatopsis sp. NPDC023774]|uniref:nitroreductase family protein n=1 Tax=Amycolatopsis sp. NPDC023774 TaxID=3155015 RepID=UPI0033E95249
MPAVAAAAPSGANLQPWHVYVVTGAPRAELKKRTGERIAAGHPWDEAGDEQYPATLKSRRDVLQTVMLLRADDLHSCPQPAWAKFHKTVSGSSRRRRTSSRSAACPSATRARPSTSAAPGGRRSRRR